MYHTLRRKRIISRYTAIGALLLLNALFLSVMSIRAVSFPNRIVGSTDVGLQTRSSIHSFLTREYEKPFRLTINTRSYDVTYEQLGIYLDTANAVQTVFSPNRTMLPYALSSFFNAFFEPRHINIPLSFSQDFYSFVEKMNQADQNPADTVSVDQTEKTLMIEKPKQLYVIDTEKLEHELTAHFGGTSTTVIAPLLPAVSPIAQDINTVNAKLKGVYDAPLTLIIGVSGTNRFITFSPESLRSYTIASISSPPTGVSFSVQEDLFRKNITSAFSEYQAPMALETTVSRASQSLSSALLTRYSGVPIDSVKVNVDDGPNTNGTTAEKYIEVDISQQRMFTFQHGKLVHMYRVSTGKDYPTPTGSFTILNKLSLGFSAIYNVWMPYWMGFSYSDTLHAYFGIHELPFYYVGEQKIQRPRDFIGVPNTGGCVALDVGDAKAVFQFADIGTPVVIYQ